MRQSLKEIWQRFMSLLDESNTEDKAVILAIFYILSSLIFLITMWSTYGFIRGIIKLIVGVFAPEAVG